MSSILVGSTIKDNTASAVLSFILSFRNWTLLLATAYIFSTPKSKRVRLAEQATLANATSVSEYSRREYQKNHIFCGFLLFLEQKSGFPIVWKRSKSQLGAVFLSCLQFFDFRTAPSGYIFLYPSTIYPWLFC